MILTKEALMKMVEEKFNESDDEGDLTFIENITDTVEDMSKKASEGDYKQKYLDLQKRYKDRFFGRVDNDDNDDFEEEGKDYNKLSYEDLFTKK